VIVGGRIQPAREAKNAMDSALRPPAYGARCAEGELLNVKPRARRRLHTTARHLDSPYIEMLADQVGTGEVRRLDRPEVPDVAGRDI